MRKGSKEATEPSKVKETAVLRDSFVPAKEKARNLVAIHDRWILSSRYLNGASPNEMDLVIAQLAKNFIPQVPCTCCIPLSSGISSSSSSSMPVHGPQFYSPMPTHKIPPDLTFALRSDSNAAIERPYFEADLDETTSIAEYASTFRSALQLEHEELMRLYEKYSLMHWKISRFNVKTAAIHYVGICDARPSLQVSDIVLLRPRMPVMGQSVNHYGQLINTPFNIEIETRIVSILRGYRNQSDQVIIDWDLTHDQIQALNDPTWARGYTIRFIPSSTMLERSVTALDWLEDSSTAQRKELEMVLFPVSAPAVKPLSRDQMRLEIIDGDINQLNELQSSFVRMVRARTLDPSFDSVRPPMILTGPAGTGKTKTLICAIVDVLGLLQQDEQGRTNTNRVLICCPSHAASDVLTRRLSRYLKHNEIFRMYDASRHSNTVPDYILPFACQTPGLGTFSLPSPSVWKGFRAVVCTCMDAHILFRANLTNHCIKSKRDCFKSFLLPANNTLGMSFEKITSSEEIFFSHLFLDEAAQATEPEILCPISCVVDTHPNSRKVEIALIGDPRQLSPRIYVNKVGDSLGRSFMERLLRRPVTCLGGGEQSLLGPSIKSRDNVESISDLIRYYANIDGQEQLTIFLSKNYRGHPSFLMMPSSFFYYDRLTSANTKETATIDYWCSMLRKVEALSQPARVWAPDVSSSKSEAFSNIYRQTAWPVHFRGVIGRDSSVGLAYISGTESWQNIPEAEAVVSIVSTLITNGVAQKQIGVMSPFRGQVMDIRNRLRKNNFYDVNVGTIDNYQAVEQDVIVLSLTRSNHEFVDHDVQRRTGIFMQPKQANVAMTRAENLFIVVGDPSCMWKDPCWRQWLLFCYRNGLWYGSAPKEWEDLTSNPLDGVKYVSTLDPTAKVDEGLVVRSSLEQVLRIHSDRGRL